MVDKQGDKMNTRQARKQITNGLANDIIKEMNVENKPSAPSRAIAFLNKEQCFEILRNSMINWNKVQDPTNPFEQKHDGQGKDGQDGDGQGKDGQDGDGQGGDGQGQEESKEEKRYFGYDKPKDEGQGEGEPKGEGQEESKEESKEESEGQNQGKDEGKERRENNKDLQFVTTTGVKNPEEVHQILGVDILEGKVDDKNALISKLLHNLASSQKTYSKQAKTVKSLEDKMKRMGSGNMTVKVSTIKKGKKIKGTHYHPRFEEIVKKLQLNPDKCVYLCGEAGSGKTTVAKQVAEVMELQFAHISCSEGMSEGHLTGKMLFNGEYVLQEFTKLYEEGGVFLLDEMDAMDSNVAVVINSALANGILSVPNRRDNPTARRHKDFYCIGAGNTWGTGQGSNMYQGRNKQDGAVLDRFMMIDFGYDEKLDMMLAQDENFFGAVSELKRRVKEYQLNRIVGTRKFKIAGIYHANGESLKDLMEALVVGWTKEEISKVGISDIISAFTVKKEGK